MTVGTINSPLSLAIALRFPAEAVDLFELRLDAFAETPETLLRAIPRLKAPLLITARGSKEGGLVPLSISKRAALLEQFIPKARLMDIELSAIDQLGAVVEAARRSGLQVIGSFHDFKSTPSSARLLQKARAAHKSGVDIFKVATLTRTPADVARLLNLFSTAKMTLSVMGMGPLGKASRLLFAQAGSLVNYGFLDPKAQVSGQWEARLLKKRISELTA